MQDGMSMESELGLTLVDNHFVHCSKLIVSSGYRNAGWNEYGIMR